MGVNPSQLWFLLMLFNVFIIVWLINDYINNIISAFIISLVFWVIGKFANYKFQDIYCIFTSLIFVIYFVIEMKIRSEQLKLLYKIPSFIYFIIHLFIFVYMYQLVIKMME